VAVFSVITWRQIGFWKSTITLFTHTLAVTKENLRAEYNLAVALQNAGLTDEAITHYLNALAIHRTAFDTRTVTRLEADMNLALIYAGRADWPAAYEHFRGVLEMDPDSLQAHEGAAGSLIGMGRFDDALRQCEAALNLNDRDSAAWRWMGQALAGAGKGQEALRALQHAVRLNPDGPAELNDLAWFWATYPVDALRNGRDAVRAAQRACQLTGWSEPRCLATLDAAYAEAGNFTKAIETARRSISLAQAAGQIALATAAEQRMVLYKEGKPWRQSVSGQ
jgi:tetratricopeptide (TPR) repeat protein